MPQAFPLPQDPTYMDFFAAGHNDAWAEIFPLVPGLTCCQAQFVNNTTSELYQCIDLILTLGNVEAQNIALFGVNPSTKTAGGLPGQNEMLQSQDQSEMAEFGADRLLWGRRSGLKQDAKKGYLP